MAAIVITTYRIVKMYNMLYSIYAIFHAFFFWNTLYENQAQNIFLAFLAPTPSKRKGKVLPKAEGRREGGGW